MSKTKINPLIIITGIIILVVIMQSGGFKDLGLFSTTTPSLECIEGEQKCCNTSNRYNCIDGTGIKQWVCSGGQWTVTGDNPLCQSSGQICTAGQTRCVGSSYYICPNGKWKFEGLKNGKCGYVIPQICTPNNYLCENNVYKKCSSDGTSKSTINTCTSAQSCDVSKGGCYTPTTQICTSGQTKCEGYNKYTCSNNAWGLSETNSTTCGYIENPTECTNCTETECSSSDDCLQGYYCEETNGECIQCPTLYSLFSIMDCGYKEADACYSTLECYKQFEATNYCTKWSCQSNKCVFVSNERYGGCCNNNAECEYDETCINHICESTLTSQQSSTQTSDSQSSVSEQSTTVTPAQESAKPNIIGIILLFLLFGGAGVLLWFGITKWGWFK